MYIEAFLYISVTCEECRGHQHVGTRTDVSVARPGLVCGTDLLLFLYNFVLFEFSHKSQLLNVKSPGFPQNIHDTDLQ